MDSTTMLYEYKDEIAMAITFDYGSTQNGRERQWAITHCQRLGIKHLIIRLDFMHQYFKSALLESADAIPDGNYDDENMKRASFVDAMSAAMQQGTYEGIQVFAPYTHLSKADIARHGAALGLNYAETYSCYKGGEHHCGTCGTCTERRQALREAGIEDKTIYDN